MEELAQELCAEDIELKILNELYNNNLKASLVEENLYEISCSYKSFLSVLSLVVAMMKDVFYTLFESKIDVKVECMIRE